MRNNVIKLYKRRWWFIANNTSMDHILRYYTLKVHQDKMFGDAIYLNNNSLMVVIEKMLKDGYVFEIYSYKNLYDVRRTISSIDQLNEANLSISESKAKSNGKISNQSRITSFIHEVDKYKYLDNMLDEMESSASPELKAKINSDFYKIDNEMEKLVEELNFTRINDEIFLKELNLFMRTNPDNIVAYCLLEYLNEGEKSIETTSKGAIDFKNQVLINEIAIFEDVSPATEDKINLEIKLAIEEIAAIEVFSLNEEDANKLKSTLSKKKSAYTKSRLSYFRPINDTIKSFIQIDKAYTKKIDELKKHIDTLTEKTRLELEDKREQKIIQNINNLLPLSNNDVFYKNFQEEINDYIDKEKKRNILTAYGQLKPVELDKLQKFISVFTEASSVLGEIGILKFKSNGHNISEALEWEKQVFEISRKKIEEEKTIDEQLKVEQIQNSPNIHVNNGTNVITKVIKFEYTPDKANLVEDLIHELRQKGVFVEIQE